MKKIIIIIISIIAVLILAVVGTMFISLKDYSAINDGQALNGFATVVEDGMASCYLFDMGNGKIGMIDACDDPEAKAVLAALKKKGVGPDAVAAVFLTHGDSDHVAACPLFKNARIYCSEADAAIAEGRKSPRESLSFLFRIKPRNFKITDFLKDGETVRASAVDVRVFAVPGHTKGSSAFLANGVLFLGDSANARRDGTLGKGHFIFTENRELNKLSMKSLADRLKLMAGEIKVLAPSHTGTIEGLKPLLDLVGVQ